MREVLLRLLLAAAALGSGFGVDAGHPDGPSPVRFEQIEAWAAVATPRAAGRTQARLPGPAGAIRGRVDVRRTVTAPAVRPGISDLAARAPRDLPDFRSAIVYLESAPAGAFEERQPMRGRIDQRNETFVPHVLAVTAGSLVDFPNSDRTYHNVFSLSRTRRFDLGRYPQGRSKSVRFETPGIVRVFCDIHSHMSAFVLVFGHAFFDTTGAGGEYRIDGVPPGTYTVAAWYEGDVRATRPVTIPPDGGAVDLDFLLP